MRFFLALFSIFKHPLIPGNRLNITHEISTIPENLPPVSQAAHMRTIKELFVSRLTAKLHIATLSCMYTMNPSGYRTTLPDYLHAASSKGISGSKGNGIKGKSFHGKQRSVYLSLLCFYLHGGVVRYGKP